MIDFTRNHFELFGLPAHYALDVPALERAYRALQADVHPDRHAAGGDAERRMALQASARVNEAYGALKDPVARGQYLLALRGVDALPETDTALPLDFLEAQLERREAADEAQTAGDEDALAALVTAVRADRRRGEDALGRALDAGEGSAAARTLVRELRFLAKLDEDLDAMLAALEER